jgi:hypothetical protein
VAQKRDVGDGDRQERGDQQLVPGASEQAEACPTRGEQSYRDGDLRHVIAGSPAKQVTLPDLARQPRAVASPDPLGQTVRWQCREAHAGPSLELSSDAVRASWRRTGSPPGLFIAEGGSASPRRQTDNPIDGSPGCPDCQRGAESQFRRDAQPAADHCSSCEHPLAAHDQVAHRYCEATLRMVLTVAASAEATRLAPDSRTVRWLVDLIERATVNLKGSARTRTRHARSPRRHSPGGDRAADPVARGGPHVVAEQRADQVLR